MRPRYRTASRSALALALALGASACGVGGSPGGTESVPVAAADAPALQSFDIYAIGSDAGNVLFADVYGITLNPLRAHRITTGERISALSADPDTVVVAAADEQIDKLAMVAEGGNLVPVPGLGRPHAFSPEIQPDGTIRYEDGGPEDDEKILARYLSYDPASRRTKVLYKTSDDTFNVGSAVPGGRFLQVVHNESGNDRLIFVGRDGSRRSYTIAPRITGPQVGRKLVAIGVFSSPDVDAPKTDTVLLDLKSGSKQTVEGWAPLAWSPDGTRLLVVRTADTALPDAELAVLDPARPDSPQSLGTIPNLTLFSGSWVRPKVP